MRKHATTQTRIFLGRRITAATMAGSSIKLNGGTISSASFSM